MFVLQEETDAVRECWVQFTVYTYLISGLICFPFFEWGCLMGHKGRQLYICTADICFIIDSTPGKWSPQSPFLPQSPFFSHLYHLFTFSCCCRHAAYISCSFRWVDFWSKTTLFLSPSVRLERLRRFRVTCSCPRGEFITSMHKTCDSSTQTMWKAVEKKKKGHSNYIFVPHAHP